MRILVVRPGPNFSVADVARGYVDGFTTLGHQVADLNFDDRLTFYEEAHHQRDGEWRKSFDTHGAVRLANKGISATCYEFDPDVVVVVSGFYVDPLLYRLIRAHGSRVVLIHTESPYEEDRQLERAGLVDLNVLNDPTNLDRYPPGTIYLGHCYDPATHNPWGPTADRTADVVIVGTGYPSRIALLEQVDWSGIDLALAGNWAALPDDSPLRDRLVHPIDECLPNDQAANLYRAARMSVNLYRQETTDGGTADGWAMGPREVELAACGTFFVTEARGENRAVLPMIPTFTGPAELEQLLRWHLAHPDETAAIAAAARTAIADRTFVTNCSRLLEAVT